MLACFVSFFFLLYIFPPDFIGVRQPLNRAPFGLRVNAAVFAFIIYFFRLLFELPALILDQSNKFYWFQILTLFYMCLVPRAPRGWVCVGARKENAANPYMGPVVTTKYGKIFYDDAIVVSEECGGGTAARDATHLRTARSEPWWVRSPAFSEPGSFRIRLSFFRRLFNMFVLGWRSGGGPQAEADTFDKMAPGRTRTAVVHGSVIPAPASAQAPASSPFP